jgi:DUF4097 and DUF4098 domain-containing protein YvlB
MKRADKIVIFMVAILCAAGWTTAYERYEEMIDETVALSPNGEVSLDNINGDVTVEVWDSAEVRIQAVKEASSQDLLDGLRVEIDADGDSVRIDTDYPSNKRSRDYDHDHDRGERRHMKVEYTLTVPRTARLNGVDLVNGNLMIVGVEGGIEAETVNGSIVVREAAGDASLATVNGGIELYLDRLGSGEDVDLETVNGSIDLYLASSAGADIKAETVNGRLTNDLGIDVKKGKYVGASFAGSVGGGGSKVDLETVNGKITVHSW